MTYNMLYENNYFSHGLDGVESNGLFQNLIFTEWRLQLAHSLSSYFENELSCETFEKCSIFKVISSKAVMNT